MSSSINRNDLALLLADHDPPCLSLYQPTHRRYPENQQDPIRYKNLLRTLEESLRRHYSTKDASCSSINSGALRRLRLLESHMGRSGGFRRCGVVPGFHTSSFSP